VNAVFLVAYLVLPLVAVIRSRSIAWTVVMLATSVSLVGLIANTCVDRGVYLTWTTLQWMLLLALAAPAVLAFLWPPRGRGPVRRQLLAIVVPVAALTVFFAVVLTLWTEVPAYETPVGFLMGHAVAEDNAKWLDFTAYLASGNPITQSVPMGGPLQLVLTFVATLLAVISSVAFGGVNEVMVAANTVVYGQFLMVVLAPLALAPLAEARLRRPTPADPSRTTRVPAPLIWIGSLLLVSAVLMATAYGHLTWQYTALVAALWMATFLVGPFKGRSLLLSSVVMASAMTVWLPLNGIAAALVVGWIVILVVRGVRGRGWDVIGLAILAYLAFSLWIPIRSSLAFVIASAPEAAGAVLGGGLRGVSAAVGALQGVTGVRLGIAESTLFAAGGGTERTTPLLAGLAAVALVAAAVVISRQGLGSGAYLRFLPVAAIGGFAVLLNVLDQWATGSAPNYGSLKFTFLAVIVIASVCLPVGLLLLDPAATGMTVTRWAALAAVVLILIVDSLLVRSIAAARPEQWSPEVPWPNVNDQSYWWPAEVNGTADQPIAANPVGCVYLPQGAKGPSAILDSQLSEPQRVYSCTRLLAGLAGEDFGAQPMVDWLRREWLTNERAWEGVHGYLAAMPDAVLDRPVILLDDFSKVVGLETMRSLLDRYPATVWSEAQ